VATNQYFNFYTSSNEQDLTEKLIIESIQIKGFDVHYIPREAADTDYLTGDSPMESYAEAFDVEMYLESVDGFGGDTMLMSKFGLTIEDTATLVVSKKRFKEEADKNIFDSDYPLMGDLIYLPMSKSLLEIEHVDNEEPFYQLGKNYVFKLKVRLFNYNQQEFATGIDAVDDFIDGINIMDDEDLVNDEFADNDNHTNEAFDSILDLSKDNPFIKK
jgi:hypothetical protein